MFGRKKKERVPLLARHKYAWGRDDVKSLTEEELDELMPGRSPLASPDLWRAVEAEEDEDKTRRELTEEEAWQELTADMTDEDKALFVESVQDAASGGAVGLGLKSLLASLSKLAEEDEEKEG